MKTLVYYVSFSGESFYESTRKCVETLIKIGKHSGDVKILTDVDSFLIDAPSRHIGFINCKNRMNGMIERLKGVHGVRYFRNIKGSICNFVNIDEYDAVMYLDSDVLINAPIDSIFQMSCREGKIVVQNNDNWIGDSRAQNDPTMGYDVLDQKQKKYLNGHGFCTGIVCVPKKHFHLFETWHNKNCAENFLKSDQGNFHWVIAELQLLESIHYIEAMPFIHPHRERIFLHYWCSGKCRTNFNDKYRKLMAMYKKNMSHC